MQIKDFPDVDIIQEANRLIDISFAPRATKVFTKLLARFKKQQTLLSEQAALIEQQNALIEHQRKEIEGLKGRIKKFLTDNKDRYYVSGK